MAAMTNEVNSMERVKVSELVDLPLRLISIGNKWFLKLKRQADGSMTHLNGIKEKFYVIKAVFKLVVTM